MVGEVAAGRSKRGGRKTASTKILYLSHDQLRPASLIGRNAVTWRWALSNVHRVTVNRQIVQCLTVTWRSLDIFYTVNVINILRSICLRFVCFALPPSCRQNFHAAILSVKLRNAILVIRQNDTQSFVGCALLWHLQPLVVIFPCPTHYHASSVKCLTNTKVCMLKFAGWAQSSLSQQIFAGLVAILFGISYAIS